MQIEPLNLSHQHLLKSRLQQINLSISEYSFANLYLFRQLHHYEVIELGGEIFIRGFTRDKVSFIMLTSHPIQISRQILQQVLPLAQILFPIPENWLGSLDKWFLQISFKEEDNDYLYTVLKLATYRGRHLDGKRNQVKHLLNHYEVKSEIFSPESIKDAQQVLDEWQQERDDDITQTDYSSCYEAIYNLVHLHLHGRIVYVNQKPAGFVIGEWLNKDCYTVHFSKALRSLKGLYQYLFQDLAQSLEGKCSWVNLEQDLGIPALRNSKLSYQPDLLVKKWRVKF